MTGTATAQPTCKVEEGKGVPTECKVEEGKGVPTECTNTNGTSTATDGQKPCDVPTDGAEATGIQRHNVASVMAPPRVFTGAVGRCLHAVPTFRGSIFAFPFLLGRIFQNFIFAFRFLLG